MGGTDGSSVQGGHRSGLLRRGMTHREDPGHSPRDH